MVESAVILQNMTKFDKDYKNEIKRLKNLYETNGVQKELSSAMNALINNVAWMKVKLDEGRALMEGASIVIEYDNGGGQKGMRENPLFKGYEALFKTYMSGMSKLLDEIPKAEAEVTPKETTRSALELVKSRRNIS